jgi:hypothetical protein
MDEALEKKRIVLERHSDPCPQASAMEVRRVVSAHLNPLGENGWMIIAIGEEGKWVDVQRPLSWLENGDRYEYAAFIDSRSFFLSQAGGYSPSLPYASVIGDWDAHIEACGWRKISEGSWISPHSASVPLHAGKKIYLRKERWRGHDDGDIAYQLEAQWPKSMPFPHERELLEIFKQVLKAKWELSEDACGNISTYQAVKTWIHTYCESGYDAFKTRYRTWVVSG